MDPKTPWHLLHGRKFWLIAYRWDIFNFSAWLVLLCSQRDSKLRDDQASWRMCSSTIILAISRDQKTSRRGPQSETFLILHTVSKASDFANHLQGSPCRGQINLAGMLGRAVGVALDPWRQAKQEFKTDAPSIYDYRLGMEVALMINPVRVLGKFPRKWDIKLWKQALMKISG